MSEHSPLPVLADLSSVEQMVINYARRGLSLRVSKLSTYQLETSNNPEDCVRAELIRELLLGLRGPLDPRGVRVEHARITGALDLSHVTAVTGLTLHACVFDNGIVTNGGQLPWLHLSWSHLPTIAASGLRVDGDVHLDAVKATGSIHRATIRLSGARIGGLLSIADANIHSTNRTAVDADRLRVSEIKLVNTNISGTEQFSAAIDLSHARIDGQLDLENITFDIEKESTALRLRNATVAGTVVLNALAVCRDTSHRHLSHPHPTWVHLHGFTFDGIGFVDWGEWLHIIRFHTRFYSPGPYQQLAAVERAAGHDGNARRVLIAQQRDLHRRARGDLGGWWTRRFHWLWGALAEYGYRVRRTVLALLLALVAAAALSLWAGQVTTRQGHHAAERPTSFSNLVGQPCSTVELIGLGLDRGLPLSPTGVRSRCDLDSGTRWGQLFTAATWLIQAAVWGLATLALAGYTGLVRKIG